MDTKKEITPVQKTSLLEDDKNDVFIVLLDGISEEEKKRLQKAYKYARIIEENQLKYLNKGQKKSFSITLRGGEKRDPEKVADLFSKIFDKDKIYKVTVVFRESSRLTEEQKKIYVDKLRKSLENSGINLSVVSYKNEELKSSKMKSKLEKRNKKLERLSKEEKLKNQTSQIFGKVEKSRNSYTI